MIISKRAILRKLAFRLHGSTIFKVSSFQKSMKNLQKIIANLEQENIGAKIAQKRDLDGSGARFGRGLGKVLGGV